MPAPIWLAGCLTYKQMSLAGSSANRQHAVMTKTEEFVQAQRLAAFPRLNPNPVLEFNGEGALTYANAAACTLARELGKQRVLDILPTDVASKVVGCWAAGTPRRREEVCLHNRTLIWSFLPFPEAGVVHCYGEDVTESLRREEQLRQAQKLASISQMASGIAHDFNNILTIIQGYADCLYTRHQTDKPLADPLKRIGEAARRAAALTRQLLMFSRTREITAPKLDFNTMLRGFIKSLPRHLGNDIVVETDFAPELPLVHADPGMLEQIIFNLAVNARDAMPQGGRLLFATRWMRIDEAYVRQHAEARPGWFVCLSVQDNGSGINEKILGRVFEPFFSTKGVGQGTGLGLSTVHGIVKQHQGWVELSSEVGTGTTFRIFFPTLPPKLKRETKTTDCAPARRGKETVLHVEDEPILRELVREILGQYEYRILEAGSGIEALKVWEANQGKVDLLLTDMVMPEGMDGRELADNLRSRKPGLKVIYTSGYGTSTFTKNHDSHDGLWLEKPYQPSKLARTVRECLDQSTHSETESDDVPAVCSEGCEAPARETVPA